MTKEILTSVIVSIFLVNMVVLARPLPNTPPVARPARPVRPTRLPNAPSLFASTVPGEILGPHTEKPYGGLFEILNNGQLGSASAGGAGTGSVTADGVATGQGTAQAQAGPGGFAIGLGIGAAIETPLGPIAFGQGESVAVGK